jgi:hypothetical protein
MNASGLPNNRETWAFEPRYYADRERMGGQPQRELAHPLKATDDMRGDACQVIVVVDET